MNSWLISASVCRLTSGGSSRALTGAGVSHWIAPESVRYQNAWGVACAAMEQEARGAEELLPVYLRLSQAERELNEKRNQE